MTCSSGSFYDFRQYTVGIYTQKGYPQGQPRAVLVEYPHEQGCRIRTLAARESASAAGSSRQRGADEAVQPRKSYLFSRVRQKREERDAPPGRDPAQAAPRCLVYG